LAMARSPVPGETCLLPLPPEGGSMEDLLAFMKEHAISVPTTGRGRNVKTVYDDILFHVETINRRLKRNGIVMASPSASPLPPATAPNPARPTAPNPARRSTIVRTAATSSGATRDDAESMRQRAEGERTAALTIELARAEAEVARLQAEETARHQRSGELHQMAATGGLDLESRKAEARALGRQEEASRIAASSPVRQQPLASQSQPEAQLQLSLEAEFRAMDTDGDGVVSLEEYIAARSPSPTRTPSPVRAPSVGRTTPTVAIPTRDLPPETPTCIDEKPTPVLERTAVATPVLERTAVATPVLERTAVATPVLERTAVAIPVMERTAVLEDLVVEEFSHVEESPAVEESASLGVDELQEGAPQDVAVDDTAAVAEAKSAEQMEELELLMACEVVKSHDRTEKVGSSSPMRGSPLAAKAGFGLEIDEAMRKRVEAKMERDAKEKGEVERWMREEGEIKERLLGDIASQKEIINLLSDPELPERLQQFVDVKELKAEIVDKAGQINRLSAEKRMAELSTEKRMEALKDELKQTKLAKVGAERRVLCLEEICKARGIEVEQAASQVEQKAAVEDKEAPVAAIKSSSLKANVFKVIVMILLFLIIRKFLLYTLPTGSDEL